MKTPEFKPSVKEKIEAEFFDILINTLRAQNAMADYAWDNVMGLNPKKGKPSKKELPPWLYKLAIKRDFDDPEVKDGIQKAFKNREVSPEEYNDLIRLYDKSQEEFTDQKALKTLNEIDIKLLENWYHPSRDWGMCLCFYTDNALSKMIDFLSDVKLRYSGNAVAKVYKRMNLKKAPTLLFKDVEFEGAKAIPVAFKNKLV